MGCAVHPGLPPSTLAPPPPPPLSPSFFPDEARGASSLWRSTPPQLRTRRSTRPARELCSDAPLSLPELAWLCLVLRPVFPPVPAACPAALSRLSGRLDLAGHTRTPACVLRSWSRWCSLGSASVPFTEGTALRSSSGRGHELRRCPPWWPPCFGRGLRPGWTPPGRGPASPAHVAASPAPAPLRLSSTGERPSWRLFPRHCEIPPVSPGLCGEGRGRGSSVPWGWGPQQMPQVSRCVPSSHAPRWAPLDAPVGSPGAQLPRNLH
ncbi:hypothetical protein HJG60_011075 [Phyllostomus discolor]|uniref:Uncharacterized protein n=1 Tax=Phyllostomus discolor TaxID=89673 RepID=A0A834ACH7_9CHIR|nr:hypothetical protein HJG60_011075 [Phyllostomus discolor]